MFTLEQIEELHRRLGNAETLSDYVRSLAALGVARYDSFVSDGHSEYLGRNADRVTSPAVHDELTVAESSDRDYGDHLVETAHASARAVISEMRAVLASA